jgi:hypothetical protein
MDGKPWSPLASAAAAFAFVSIIGIVVAIALIHGDLHVHAFERGSAVGQGVGVLAAIAAAIVYIVQKRRVADASARVEGR